MLTSSGGHSMLTVADRGREGVKFAKILLTSYVNAPHARYLCSRDALGRPSAAPDDMVSCIQPNT